MNAVARAAVAPAIHTRPHWHAADRLGATASLLCAVHCAALPFVLALLPLLGLGFLAGHAFERGFVLFAATLASIALLHGYRLHRRRWPLVLAVPGLVLLVAGVCVDLDVAVTAHTLMVTAGGTLVACGHVVNLRLSRALRGGAARGPCSHQADGCYHAGARRPGAAAGLSGVHPDRRP